MESLQYYIDGNFDLDALPIKGGALYSSSYSNCKRAHTPIELEAEIQQQIKEESFNRVISFYNKHEQFFQTLRDKEGVDVWFLEHFRLTFKYRNFQLKIAVLKQFLNKFPEGKVISSDKGLELFISKDRLILHAETQENKKETSVSKELRYILSQWKVSYQQDRRDLILSVWDDNIAGRDKRFGTLDIEMDKLLNREIFNPNQKLPSDESGYKNKNNVDQLVARYLLTIKAPVDLLRFRKELKKLLNQLKNTLTEQTPEDLVIIKYFQSAEFSLYIYFIRYRAFLRFFRKTNYRSISFINENSAQQKVIQYAAHKQHVKTVGIQHGAIYPSHPAYMYGRYKTVPLLPDLTFVWGEHYQKMLLEHGGYQSNQVVTSGRIPELNSNRVKHAHLSTAKKCIVYATQPQPDMNLRKRELKAVLNAVRLNAKDCLLVLRPHPAEVEDDLFLEIANEVGFTDFLIDRTSDLISHFEAADIFITSYSTVGAEFVPYHKPMLILDFLKADMVNYISQEVGIPVYQESDLAAILSGSIPEINESAHKEFTNNYFYKNGDLAVEIIGRELGIS